MGFHSYQGLSLLFTLYVNDHHKEGCEIGKTYALNIEKSFCPHGLILKEWAVELLEPLVEIFQDTLSSGWFQWIGNCKCDCVFQEGMKTKYKQI